MNASRKVVELAGVVIGLGGVVCVGAVAASTALSLSHFSELLGRAAHLAGWALVGLALIGLGALLMGRTQLRAAMAMLRHDLGDSFWVESMLPANQTGGPTKGTANSTEPLA